MVDSEHKSIFFKYDKGGWCNKAFEANEGTVSQKYLIKVTAVKSIDLWLTETAI